MRGRNAGTDGTFPVFRPSQICPVSRKLGNVPSVPKFPVPKFPKFPSAKPKYTLVHEVFLHAYAALSDSAVFADSVFQQNGLLNSSQSSSTNISNWVSTDCKCTPGISTGTCNMNSANW
jgi:hypothetical protein